MNGTIYYDESSRGYHNNTPARTPYRRGRWVGEKMVEGKRVRMRSADYNKVVHWLKGSICNNNLIELKATWYKVDVTTGDIYGRGGRRLKPNYASGFKRFHISIDGKKYCISANRIQYAALHNIDVRKIPNDVLVISDDGELKLINKREFASKIMTNIHHTRRENVTKMLLRREKEVQLLLDYYENGSREAIQYALMQTDVLVKYILGRRMVGYERAIDIAAEAVEHFIDGLEKGAVVKCDITHALRTRCKLILLRDRRKSVL